MTHGMGNSWQDQIDDGDVLYVNVSPNVSPTGVTPQWAAGTAVFAGPSYNAPEPALRKWKFCQECGNPIIDGKQVRQEHDVNTGLMNYKWNLSGCQKYKFWLQRPWLVKLIYKLRGGKWLNYTHEFMIARYEYNWEARSWLFEGQQSLFEWWSKRPRY